MHAVLLGVALMSATACSGDEGAIIGALAGSGRDAGTTDDVGAAGSTDAAGALDASAHIDSPPPPDASSALDATICTLRAVDDRTCDGVDDDCDERMDEDYEPVRACGVGKCAATATPSSCGNGVETPCRPGAPAADDSTCDGVDDDCDGREDEDYVGRATRCGVGSCAAEGRTSCVGGAERNDCEPGRPLVEAEQPCNCVDDDCDGEVDERCLELALDLDFAQTRPSGPACAALGAAFEVPDVSGHQLNGCVRGYDGDAVADVRVDGMLGFFDGQPGGGLDADTDVVVNHAGELFSRGECTVVVDLWLAGWAPTGDLEPAWLLLQQGAWWGRNETIFALDIRNPGSLASDGSVARATGEVYVGGEKATISPNHPQPLVARQIERLVAGFDGTRFVIVKDGVVEARNAPAGSESPDYTPGCPDGCQDGCHEIRGDGECPQLCADGPPLVIGSLKETDNLNCDERWERRHLGAGLDWRVDCGGQPCAQIARVRVFDRLFDDNVIACMTEVPP